MGDPMEKQRQKQAFLAIIKWCSRETGAKIMFDIDDGNAPRANIVTRTIHMPKRISVASSDAFTMASVTSQCVPIRLGGGILARLSMSRHALRPRLVQRYQPVIL